VNIDRFTVTGLTSLQSFELLPKHFDNRSTGTVTPAGGSPWSLALEDGALLVTDDWSSTAAPTTRYVEYALPGIVPAGATITGATFRHAWRANSTGGAGNVCFYYQVWSGGSQVGANINQAAPTCNNSKTVTVGETITLPALTVAQANDLKIRAIGTSSNNRNSQIDRAELSVTYSRW
jgi:hypothetical protein